MRGEARRLRVLEFEAQTLEDEARTFEDRAKGLADEVHSLRQRSAALRGSATLVRERSGLTTSLVLRAEVLEATAAEADEWAARQGARMRAGALRRDAVGPGAARLLAEAVGLEGVADDLERDGQADAAAEYRSDAKILRSLSRYPSYGADPDDTNLTERKTKT